VWIGHLPLSNGSYFKIPVSTLDELKFSKFIDRIRNKFSDLFDQALRLQCVLKGICTDAEWKEFKEHIHYNFIKDNNFTELKEAELLQNRLNMLATVQPYIGQFYSKRWVQENVLQFDENEIEQMQKEMDVEAEEMQDTQ
jgi:hypothetical protein